VSTTIHRADFTDPHDLLPRRFSHVFEIVALGAILAGDAVAFQQIVAVAMAQSSTRVTWTLIIALSAAATVSMHLAGVATRRRRAGAHQPGLPWFLCVVAAWLGLGGTALWFRLVHAAADHAAATDNTGVFGAAAPTGSATDVPLAALMLGLYLVGGITAYGIGYAMHNPARGAFLRATRAHRRAERAHRRALWRRQRATARLASPISGMVWERVLRLLMPRPRVTAPPRAVPAEVDVTDELAAKRELVISRANAQAEQLRQVARHRIATALADPARTSGVFDGQPLPTDPPHLQAQGDHS
jgi:hypothetical protein